MGDDTLDEIEQDQKRLQQSIDESKQLSARSDQLLRYARGDEAAVSEQ